METTAKLEQSLCILMSMGTVITALVNPDQDPPPDLTCLSDLGRVITKEAETALEVLSEGAKK